jgi:hypothetical protein
MYFQYLDGLKNKYFKLDIGFEESYRILYNADKKINKKNKLKNTKANKLM